VEVTPGGYRVCAEHVVEATSCTMTMADQCCSSADCEAKVPGTKCYEEPVEPHCGGAQLISNVCAADRCASDADCPGPNGVCVPAGTLGRKIRSCMPSGCRLDRDCTAQPGGFCAPVTDGCCQAAMGLYCIYADGCRADSDCKAGQFCATDGTRTVCKDGLRTCPG
jgi:hypothetical protein